MSGERQLLIFGLDGATLDLLNKWFDRGKLSFLEKLIKGGARSEIRSTLPPVTGPAWASFQTGVNPGKHGIFDWGSSSPESYGQGMVDSTSLKTETIWELASKAGKKVGVVGTPVTYPPRKINGFVTTGVLTPKDARDYVYPPDLREEIEDKIGEYKTAPPHAEMAVNNQQWVQELKKTITNKEKVATHLLTSREWDVSMIYFMETDTVKHHLFPKNLLSREGDDEEEKGDFQPALEVYKRVEKALKRIYQKTSRKSTNVIVVSDHGFGPLEWIFNVNSWLIENEYMKLKETPSTRIKKAVTNLGLNQRNLYKIGDFLGPLAKGNEWEMEGFEDILAKLFLSFEDVDWENTKAYSRGGVTGAVRLNVKGREPFGCLPPEKVEEVQEELMNDLTRVKNPHNGEFVVDKVMKSKEVYEGPSSIYGPDILFLTKDFKTDTGGLTVFKTLDSVIPAFAVNGTHRMNGLFSATGPNYNDELVTNGMDIVDPATIILHSLGLEIPSYMDGTLRQEVFSERFRKTHNPKFKEMKLPGLDLEHGHDKDEEIEKRLKGLGYLA